MGKVARALKRLVVKAPDATVAELTQALTERTRVVTSRDSVLRPCTGWASPTKKSLVASKRDTPPILWRRRVLAVLLTVMDVRRLVFLDESFCTTSMTREYGWAPVGQRAAGTHLGVRWTTLTLVGAIRLGSRPKLMTHLNRLGESAKHSALRLEAGAEPVPEVESQRPKPAGTKSPGTLCASLSGCQTGLGDAPPPVVFFLPRADV